MGSDIGSKCRLCLGENYGSSGMFELYCDEVGETGKSSQIKLSEKVESCCGVRIRQSPEMPSKICIQCFDITRIWFSFRQMVLNSQIYLESICTNQKIPNNIKQNETAYFNYLQEDLQNIKENIIVSDIQENLNDADDAIDYDDDDEDFITEEFERTTNTDEDSMGIKCELVEYVEDIEDEDPKFEKVLNNLGTDDIAENNNKKERNNRMVEKKKTPKQKPIKKYRPPSPSSYLCTFCGNKYQNKSTFRHHMNLHSNVKPHECEICGKSFRQDSQLKYHIRRHTGEKPYQCSYCERRFVDRSKKLRHERIHTNTRPYKCKICENSFTYSATLKNHLKTHTGQKDYHCNICNKSFALSHQMKAHLGTIMHKQKESQYADDGGKILSAI